MSVKNKRGLGRGIEALFEDNGEQGVSRNKINNVFNSYPHYKTHTKAIVLKVEEKKFIAINQNLELIFKKQSNLIKAVELSPGRLLSFDNPKWPANPIASWLIPSIKSPSEAMT